MLKLQNKYITYLYLILFLSFLHAIIRTSETSSFSLFRILLPITLITLVIKNKKYLLYILGFLVFILLNLFLTWLYTSYYLNFYIFSLHYLCILTIYIIIEYLIDKGEVTRLFIFLKYSFYFFILIVISQYIFEYNLPNVAIYTDGSRSSVFWNQNELATAVIGFTPLLLFLNKSLFKYLLLFLLLVIMYINDSKMGIIGVLIAVATYITYTFNFRSRNILYIFITFSLIIIFGVLSHYLYLDFRDYKISLYDMFIDPVERIISLNPYKDNGGSIVTRTNAVIYSIIDFKASNFLGIGSGNTITMLQKPEYQLRTAKSIHNLPVQLFVENGLLAIILSFILLKNLMINMFKKQMKNTDKLYIVSFFSLLTGTLSSSVGIYSNYFFIVCLFFIIHIIRKQTNSIEINII